jgi:hypothetical protein
MTRIFFAAGLALALAGCGYVGDPMPPLANVPERVTDLTAVQRGAALVVEFSPPKLTTEGMAIKREPTLDLRAGPAPAPFDEGAWAAQAKQARPARGDKGRVHYEFPVEGFVNKEVVVGVKVIGANGKEAGWSNFAIVPVTPAPEQPADVRAESVAGGVKVMWRAKGPRFRVFRRTGDAAFALAATVERPEYTDLAVEIGKPYEYRVETVVPMGEREAVSEVSRVARILPEDRFPPAAPKGLTVLASPTSIELTWEQNTELDIAGYRVYRAAPGAGFERVSETRGIPSYSDRQVEAGKTYRYAVTAFDHAGNEGSRSAEARGALP